MVTETDGISEITSQFVNARDNFAARHKAHATGTFIPVNGLVAFNELINGYADRIAAALPPMSLAQWEALGELVYSHTNEMRSRHLKRPLGNL